MVKHGDAGDPQPWLASGVNLWHIVSKFCISNTKVFSWIIRNIRVHTKIFSTVGHSQLKKRVVNISRI